MDAVTTRWWWIRHAPVTGHGGRIYGQSDVDADCGDAASFAALAALLPADAVWLASHLRRTHQTATAILAAGGGAAPALGIEPDLAEQNFGAWQGLTHAELAARADAAAHRFWLAPAHVAPPGGESFEQVLARVGAAVTRLTRRHAGRDIVVVAHGGTIRAALALALGLDAERALAFSLDNCSLTRLDHIGPADGSGPGQWRIVAVNRHPLRLA
ncbi:MAG: histidine phosphatase family protein [Rhodospirillaceae bacterium]|nr:histidine phosphatase family protein [Rhodospirillaceae bacterium]